MLIVGNHYLFSDTGARFHKDAIHNAEGLGDFCVKDVQDNPSLQKTIPMSAPDRSSPLKGKNDRR